MTQENPQPLELDLTLRRPWEIAAELDVRLAYPLASPTRLKALIKRMCADQLRVTIEAEPERRAELIAAYTNYHPMETRVSTKTIAKGRDNALRAGAVFLGLIQETETGSRPLRKGESVAPSLDLLVRHYWKRRSGESEDSYETRLHDTEEREVRSRYPVAHLAAALQMFAQQAHIRGEPGLYDYQDVDFLRAWVVRANELAVHIKNTRGLSTMASRLIELRWIDPKHDSAPAQEL